VQESLTGRPGIRDIRLRCESEQSDAATLELDYDPRLVTLSEIDQQAHRAGLCLSPTRAQVVLGVEGMVSPRSEQAIEAALGQLPGVVASASFPSRSVRIEFDRQVCALPEIALRLHNLGYRITPRSGSGDAALAVPAPRGRPGIPDLKTQILSHPRLLLAAIGGVFLLAAFLVHVMGGPQAVRLPLVAAAFVLCGWQSFKDTFHILRELRFDIDVLMVAAAFGAAALGAYEEGALLLFLFALGGAGEELAMDRARQAIAALAKLAPETATVRNADGSEQLVRVEDLKPGQQIVIRPSDRIPADALVVSGSSAVDQSPITGESVPVEKTDGAQLFAGTINGEGLLVAVVSRLASESTLAKIIRMVNEAQTTKSPTQVFTDAVERRYVPLVLVATAALIVVPPLAQWGAWSMWFYRAMAFLTAASPCALAIGTPAAVLSAIARAARIGVLVKGGVHLENLARVSAVAFDKTGTLTRGRPVITDVVPVGESEGEDGERKRSELLALAASVERHSSHPLARAITDAAAAEKLPLLPSENAEQLPGQGFRATVAGEVISVGHHSLLAEASPDRPRVLSETARLAGEGKTTVLITASDRAMGLIALADQPRENAAEAVRRVKALGIRRTIMLTGDNASVAAAMAKAVGVDEQHAALLPEQKVERLRELQKAYGPIAMVGDGVNDAPALAAASVGIAMGASSTDVALETADVALMSDDLGKLPDAIALSRFSRKIIRQNLVIALGVIAVLAPLAALGYAKLGLAVLFHEGSTVVVVLNSLRLLAYRPR
jgi:Cd2+/Zn2+-exporting ATPase